MNRRITKWDHETGESGICCFEDISKPVKDPKSRFTQRSTDSEYARTPAELAEDQIREPTLSEGLGFREKI